MIGVFWKNRAIVWVLCFFSVMVSLDAQPAENTSTNQTSAQPVDNSVANQVPAQQPENTGTNQPPDLGFPTNVTEVLPLATTPVYGAQQFPYSFEAQNNTSVVAGPAPIGSGQVGAPVMGTGVFGIPGFTPMTGPGIYQAGLLNVHAGLSYSFVYGTGIEDAPGQHSATVDQVVSPNLVVNVGSHWTLNYSAALNFYSASSGLGDSTGQSVSLLWSAFYHDWALEFSQGYSFSDTPLIETGTQTKEEAYVTTLSASHQLVGNLSLVVGLNQSFTIDDPFDDVDEWSGNVALNYQLSQKLQIGLNFGGGYDEASQSPAMTSETYSAVLMFRPTIKTTVKLSAGLEDESFDAAGVPSSITPIFSASIMRQLLPHTRLSLSAGRSISPSFFSNQVYTVTSVGIGLQQQLTRKLNLSVTGGYSDSSYQAIQPGVLPQYYLGAPTTSALQVTRHDVTTDIGISLAYAFRPRWNGSVSYSYSENSSSQGNYSYSSSQFTVQVNYRY
jgi:hypothetical protein